jgi:hypothetical protein
VPLNLPAASPTGSTRGCTCVYAARAVIGPRRADLGRLETPPTVRGVPSLREAPLPTRRRQADNQARQTSQTDMPCDPAGLLAYEWLLNGWVADADTPRMRSNGVTAPDSFGEISIVSGGVIICSGCRSALTRVADVCPVCGIALDASRLQIVPSCAGDGPGTLRRRRLFRLWPWTQPTERDRLHHA